jgi:hypothetical protein
VQPTPRRIPWATRQREGPPRRVQRRRRVRPAAGAESTRGRRQRRRGPDSCRQGRPFGGRVSTPQATVSLARYLFLFKRMTRHDLQLGELDAASSCGLWRLELHFASPDANHEQCESKKNNNRGCLCFLPPANTKIFIICPWINGSSLVDLTNPSIRFPSSACAPPLDVPPPILGVVVYNADVKVLIIPRCSPCGQHPVRLAYRPPAIILFSQNK